MKNTTIVLLVLFSSYSYGQDSLAHELFNSSYGKENYILLKKADSFVFDTTVTYMIMPDCYQLIPPVLLKTMIHKQSMSFEWNKTKLKHARLVSKKPKNDRSFLTLSAPIFDSTGAFALVYETYYVAPCIHSGPALFRLEEKKWVQIASQTNSRFLIDTQPNKRKRDN